MPWLGSDGAAYTDFHVKAALRLRRWEVVSHPLERLMVVAPRAGEPLRLEWMTPEQIAARAPSATRAGAWALLRGTGGSLR